MARHSWSVQDAKNPFSEVVEAARREPQAVTKHGKTAVVLLSAQEYERLRKLQQLKAPTFGEMLLGIPQGDVEFERFKTTPRKVLLGRYRRAVGAS